MGESVQGSLCTYPLITLAVQPLDYSFSGLVIDCHLPWHDHIGYICSKIGKNMNILTKVKKFLSKETLISMYYSFIYSHLALWFYKVG